MADSADPADARPATTRGMNFYAADGNLRAGLERLDPAFVERRGASLHELGAFCGGRLDEQAACSDRYHPPALRHDIVDPAAPGARRRRSTVVLNPDYEDCQQELYRRGVVGACFDPQAPESHLLPFVAQYLVSKTGIADGCPLAMTHPVACVLAWESTPADVRERFLPELTRTDGRTAIGATWATEQHSGSDVGATTTRARRQPDGSFALDGHNWFSSAFGFRKFVAIKTARPEPASPGGKGLGLYVVPSHVDTDWSEPNRFDVRALKDKLGTRGLPTAEVWLEGALAWEIAPAPHGLRVMMQALAASRVHNAMGAAGLMHRALLEAYCWSERRSTFGRRLIERPMIQARLLQLELHWMAGSALALEAARRYDEVARGGADPVWMRLVTALAKYWTAEQAVRSAQTALCLVGGNGYTEDWPTARQFRDALVLSVWEGPEEIQALELMRMLGGRDAGAAVFVERMRRIVAEFPPDMRGLRAALERDVEDVENDLRTLQARPETTELVAARFLHKLADLAAAVLLAGEAAWDVSQRGDRRKYLFAERFHAGVRHRLGRPVSFEPDVLQRAFRQLASGRPVSSDPQ